MAPEPQHRQLLSQFLVALKQTTSKAVQEEDGERRNISNDRAYGAVIQARINNLKRDSDLLQAAAELLEDQQKVLERLKACAHNAAQPVCRVPDEVLSCMFEVGAPDFLDHWDPDWNPQLARTPRLAPDQYMSQVASISATCSRFRTAVINTPRCWTYISCIVSGGRAPGTRLAALQTMLARCKSCIFTLRVELRAQHYSPSAYTLQALSSTLMPHMNRCHSLRLVSDDRAAGFPLMTPFQNVQHLLFDWSGERDHGRENEGTEDLEDEAEATMHSFISALAKPLISLALEGPRDSIQTMNQDFSTIQAQALTRLRIRVGCSVAHVFQLLQRCTLLKHLNWTVEAVGADDGRYHLVLQNLVSLQVFDAGGACGSWSLNAPRLEQIDLTGGFQIIPFNIEHPANPAFPSLTRVALTTPSNLNHLASFLLRHPLLSECVLDLSRYNAANIDGICGVLESLLNRPSNAGDDVKLHLQHLSIMLYSTTVRAGRDLIKASLALVMRELDRLHVDVHIHQWTGNVPTLELDSPELGRRLSVNPPVPLQSRWPNAWGVF